MRSKIAKIISGSTAEIYQELLEDLTYAKPHEFVGKSYDRYRDIRLTDNPSVNGRIFEYLICETLAREGIVPFYYQAQFTLVPEADFDIVLYDERFPVVLTMKTSLRERYKQAVLEGLALARVYPRAQSHLIALSDEGNKVSEKIGNQEIIGLDSCVIASGQDYTDLLETLKQRKFSTATPIDPIRIGKGKVFTVSE